MKGRMADRFIYCVDDNAAFADQLVRRLVRRGFGAQVFHSGGSFLAQTPELPFGCVLLDVRMPKLSGPDLIERLQTLRPPWPAIMMSGQWSVEDTVRSFRAGAVHLLQKPFKMDQLIAAIDEAFAVGEQALADEQRKVRASQVRLSPREQQVLEGLARGLQSKQIAWELGISVRTADLHRHRLFDKLGVRNAPAALSAGMDLGLVGSPSTLA